MLFARSIFAFLSSFGKTVGFAVLLCLPASGALAQPVTSTTASVTDVRIGVLVLRGEKTCVEMWTATADYLTDHVPPYRFRLIPLEFDQVRPAVGQRRVDFVLANSAYYVDLEIRAKIQRIATLKNRRLGGSYSQFGGVIFCRAERADISTLDDLRGKRFAAVDPDSFGGWYAGWREMQKHGLQPHKDFRDLRFMHTHDAVVLAVRRGEVDAGTVRTDVIEQMAVEGKISLSDFRILNAQPPSDDFRLNRSTPLYPEWPMAALPHVPRKQIEAVAIALIGMSNDCAAARAAKCDGWTIPLNYQPVHECLRELRVGPYAEFERVPLSVAIRQHLWPVLGFLTLLIVIVGTAAYAMRLNRRIRAALTQEKRAHEERRNAEHALRRSEKDLRVILDSVRVGCLVVEPDTYRVVLANPTALSIAELPTEQILGRDCREIIVSSDPMQNGEATLILRGGRTAPILLSVVDARVNGRPARVLTFTDLSERERAESARMELERRLRQAEKERSLGDMAAAIAHNFNNLMQAVLGNLGLLEEDLAGQPEQLESVLAARSAARRAADVSGQMLTYIGQRLPHLARTDLCPLLRQAIEVLGEKMPDAPPISVVVEEPVWVQADANQLRQAVEAVLTNAVEACAENGGAVAVQLNHALRSSEGSSDYIKYACIEVCDTGCGMDENTKRRLFDPFFSTKFTGRGLGLATALGIVRAHGGSMEVDSASGTGAVFRILLPPLSLSDSPPPAASAIDAPAGVGKTELSNPGVHPVHRDM